MLFKTFFFQKREAKGKEKTVRRTKPVDYKAVSMC